MISLFGNLESGNVHKVQMILHRVEIPYRRVDVSQTRNETRNVAYLKLNPIGKIPAVKFDSGDVLTESGAILFFFAQNTELWPDDTRIQAEVLRWMFFEQYSHEPALAVIRYLTHHVPDPHEFTDRVSELKPKARFALDVLENHLKRNIWIAHSACTIADYALYPYTRAADESGFDLDAFSSIQRWLARVETEPGHIPFGLDGAAETLSFERYFWGAL